MMGMGADVGLQRGNQENFQNQVEAAKLAMQQQQTQAALARGNGGGGGDRAVALNLQPSPMATTGGPGSGPGGQDQATVYQPQGAQMLAPQQMGQAMGYTDTSGQAAAHKSLPHGQQQGLAQLDNMHRNGQLDDFEYARRKGILLSGGDAFSEPTAAEKQHERMQQSAIETMHQQNQDKSAGDRERAARQKEDRADARQSILDQVKIKEARLKDPLLDDASRKMLHTDIDNLGRQLEAVNKPAAGGQGDGQGGQGGQKLKPLPRSLLQQAVQNALHFAPAHGVDPNNVQAILHAAKDLARQHGYDPEQITDG